MSPLHAAVPRSSISGIAWPGLAGRHAARLLSLLQQLDDSEWAPRAWILEQQLAQLGLVLRHCWDNVPYYRDRLDAAGYRREAAPDWDLLRRLPRLSREQIQEAGPRLHATAVPKDHGAISTNSTSGSTGKPVAVRVTALNGLFWRALTLRHHLWHGRDFTRRLCVIRGLKRGEAEYPGRSMRSWGPPASLVFETGPAVLLNLMTPADRQLDWLIGHDPAYLLSQPPTVAELARLSLERQVKLPSLREVQTLGGLVTADTRELVRAAWDVPIVDIYSTQEVGYVALQSPDHDHYLVQAESVIVEVVNQSGDWAAPGEWGRVVLTPLHNFAMPLLRYDVGDWAEVGAPCPEGRGLPVLSRILGRDRNMMTLPDGRRVFPAVGAGWFDGLPIRQFQVVQRSLDHVEALIVSRGAVDAEAQERMRRALAEKLRAPFRISVTLVEEIPAAANGKIEDFRSEVAES